VKSFMEIGPHVFPKSGTQTLRRTDAATLYIYICIEGLLYNARYVKQLYRPTKAKRCVHTKTVSRWAMRHVAFFFAETCCTTKEPVGHRLSCSFCTWSILHITWV